MEPRAPRHAGRAARAARRRAAGIAGSKGKASPISASAACAGSRNRSPIASRILVAVESGVTGAGPFGSGGTSGPSSPESTSRSRRRSATLRRMGRRCARDRAVRGCGGLGVTAARRAIGACCQNARRQPPSALPRAGYLPIRHGLGAFAARRQGHRADAMSAPRHVCTAQTPHPADRSVSCATATASPQRRRARLESAGRFRQLGRRSAARPERPARGYARLYRDESSRRSGRDFDFLRKLPTRR